MAEIASSPSISTQTCKKCHDSIFEGHAYELGDDRWHIQCFKCFKCDKALGCNLNFLVLGNGSLVCLSCSYNCKQCGKKIDDLAILTGDKAYCLTCFKCRVCKLKIEDLRYARTSKGLFCMACHEDLLAKKKKHNLKKKQKEQLLLLLRPAAMLAPDSAPGAGSGSSSSPSNMPSLSPAPDLPSLAKLNSSLSSVNKSLPPHPSSLGSLPRSSLASAPSLHSPHSSMRSFQDSPAPAPAPPSAPTVGTPSLMPSAQSIISTASSVKSPLGLNDAISVDSAATYDSHGLDLPQKESPDDDFENQINMRKARERLERRFERLALSNTVEKEGTILDLIESFSGPTTPTTDISMRASMKPLSETTNIATPLDLSLPTSGTSPKKTLADPQTTPGKNIMIISPSQFHDNEFHVADLVGQQFYDKSNDDAVRTRSSVSLPMAKVNRQARVVETSEEASANEHRDTGKYLLQSAITTPKRSTNLPGPITSPPPLLALPQVPTTPGSRNYGSAAAAERAPAAERADNYEPKGLGLKGMDLLKATHTVKEATPAVSNLEETIPDEADEDDANKPSRSKITRKMSLRHKRSISGGLTTGSLSSRLGFFKHKEEEKNDRGHVRHVLEGSINGQAFTTPPLPYSSPFRESVYRELHNRSNSETQYLNDNDFNLDIASIRAEVAQLDSRRQTLLADNMRLNSDRTRLKENIASLEQKVIAEAEKLEGLRVEQLRLQAENDALKELNRQLDALAASKTREMSSKSENSSNWSGSNLQPQLSNRMSQYFEVNSDQIDNMNALDAVSEEGSETQKATRLKFWRRPKVSVTPSGSSGADHLAVPTTNGPRTGNYSNNKMSSSYSSNSINTSSHNISDSSESGSAFKSLNSFITKSRSTNLLESFVNGQGASSGGDAPLFSSTIQRRAIYEGQKVPLIVSKCLEEVESRGMDVEGIYRLSGGNSAVVAIENAFGALSSNPDRKQLQKACDLLSGDINAVTSALKRYLRKLPDPLIPYALYSSFTKVGQTKGDTAERCQELQTRVILRLPAANKHTLYLIGKHLDKVNYYSSVNRMNFKNLSVVFAPTIARDSTGEREIMDMGARNEATELLFANFTTLFANYTDEPVNS
ncbi:hypothetical protein PUMCH_003407 [Australozyma saopauloensis]|uniref:Uncharacterized protein n=1 Tax=Australozyma saopauloensis TaxID=291208 RepID=A0AAX4HCQ5_9ASCO|nr:hypothetical protein PUMCH_003407 [[Candida] saopauloensis]